MLDIKLLRENPNIVKKNLEKRRDKEKLSWVQKVRELDASHIKIKKEVEELRHRRNLVSEEINTLQKQGKDIKEKIKDIRKIPDEIKRLEEKLASLKQELDYYLLRFPNLLHESVPYGKDDKGNVAIRKWGVAKKPKFELKPHGDLIEQLEIGDFTKAAEVSGAGFYYMFGKLAQLNLALMQFAVGSLVKKGFTLCIPPLMLRKKPYEGVTDLADFEKVMYKIESEDLYLIATSEHSIATYYTNEAIPEEKLPIKIVGFSPCFRKEIGSHGVDTRGLFRTHQFWKIEQFVFCNPKDSWKHHEEIQKNSEELYKKLKIPYRVVNVCTGDIGIVAAKKYDTEAWFPRQNEYREVGSNSNCTDYQARRLNIKLVDKDGGKKFLHTLNNTAIATSRALVAILENYQQKDGSIVIPAGLQKYCGFKKIEKRS
ncbi:serine--tRNA ligase [Candidatus Woesearchaeota archaeon]|nr:serine--tRNA ligase [Candidatus Woesearchaeota archaeon]